MLRIWGRISSINVRKVVWAAQELGLEFGRIDAGGKYGLTKTPGFMQKNPNGMIPVLEDDDAGVTLWESNVIVRYLCAQHSPGQLYPSDLGTLFRAEQWMDWQQTTLNPAARDAFLQWIRATDDDRRYDLITRSNATTELLLGLLDHHLQKNAYINGEHFCMADIPIACEVHRWINLPQPRCIHPHIDRWFAAIMQRPAITGVLDIPLS